MASLTMCFHNHRLTTNRVDYSKVRSSGEVKTKTKAKCYLLLLLHHVAVLIYMLHHDNLLTLHVLKTFES